jgi:hypothetical protein
MTNTGKTEWIRRTDGKVFQVIQRYARSVDAYKKASTNPKWKYAYLPKEGNSNRLVEKRYAVIELFDMGSDNDTKSDN